MFDEVTKINLLYDFYGELLSKRQREAMALYYEENLSLSEIAEEFAISRQGVHDALKNAEKSLYEYEKKLGLIKRFEKTRAAVKKIDKSIEKMTSDYELDDNTRNELLSIKAVIDDLAWI